MVRPFQIALSPIRSDATLHIERDGEVLIVNGQPIDCTDLTDGAQMSAAAFGCEALLSDIVVSEGVVQLTLLLPHGAMADETARFPSPLLLTDDGPIRLPTNPALS